MRNKRWGWVKKGAPIVIEVGGRDVAGGNVSVLRRDRLYRDDGKLDSQIVAKSDFLAAATGMLEEIQQALFADAQSRLHGNIDKSITSLPGTASGSSGTRPSTLPDIAAPSTAWHPHT